MEPDRVLRAIRRARELTQRELAAATGVGRATIERIEAGGYAPSLATVERILAATQFSLTVVDSATGGVLLLDDAHDELADRAGRRFPAHLPWFPVTEQDYEHWWGWYRCVPGTGQTQLMPLPRATYIHRRSYLPYRRTRPEDTAADP